MSCWCGASCEPGTCEYELAYERDDYDDEREPAPLFGCACQNPLSVDDCCPACIELMQELEREAEAESRQTGNSDPARA